MATGLYSNYIGVTLTKPYQRSKHIRNNYLFKAQITIGGKTKNLGHYATERLAALAYDKEAIKHGMKTNILKKKS